LGQPPGFFGKVPSHGDFVGRRLPPDVRQCFDDWLQASLVRSKQALGDEWLPIWLSSPLWRFVVGGGVCGEQAWAGVMMPSHDRVGRCFPLLLMAGIDGTPSLRDCMTVYEGWYERLEAMALSALELGFSLDAFDAVPLAATPPTTVRDSAGSAANPASRTMMQTRMDAPPVLADVEIAGRTAWWTSGSPRVTACLAVCDGFPPASSFASLLDGRWTERYWASS